MNSVFIVWQDEVTRLWHPVARLSESSGTYFLNYTKGSNTKRFKPFIYMEDTSKTYVSEELFSVFQNRIMPSSRPEFRKVINWLGLNDKEFNPLEYLAISGGGRNTDNFMIVPLPERNGNIYSIDFLVSGVRYTSESASLLVREMEEGDVIEYRFEDNNKHDSDAIALYFKDERIGYSPRYLAKDFRKLLNNEKSKGKAFSVRKANPDAPFQYKILCRLETQWSEGFTPFVSEEYADLA